MRRRLFVTGLFGFAGTAALAALIPPAAQAALDENMSSSPNVLPMAEDLKPELDDVPAEEAGQELAWHEGHSHKRRRRRRRRGWRRICRREWWNGIYRRRDRKSVV